MKFQDLKVGQLFSEGGSYFIKTECDDGVCIESNACDDTGDAHEVGVFYEDFSDDLYLIAFTGVHRYE